MEKTHTQFGTLCRKYRSEKDMNMTDAAEKLRKSQPYLSGIESGKISPTITFVKDCIKVYELTDLNQFEFLTQALRESKEIKKLSNEVSIIPKEKFIQVLAALLMNEKSTFVSGLRNIIFGL
jgi:transcriptional regulator with XRE-family HTH domain